MEGQAGPHSGEMRPQGAHPSRAAVGQASLSTHVCLGVGGGGNGKSKS